jgi:endoglucanase
VDFFLSLKTPDGYGHGLTNPTKDNALYQAAPSALAAWANAANAAMLADAFRLSGHDDLMAFYRDAAVEAWSVAESAADPMLDRSQDIGWMRPRGRDFKMMAAAFLFNVTGDTTYEDVIEAESVVRASSSNDLSTGSHEQLYATAGYLITPRTVRFPQLQANMRSAIIREAKAKEAGEAAKRATRRAAFTNPCWFQTAQHCQRTILAHYAATSPADRALLRDALVLEADWGLGRNPVNMIQMTTASTPLADKRSVELCYTSGQFDGVPGLHPGHTPYMNVANWGGSMIMGRPTWMADQSYPAWSQWPHAEGHFHTRHVYANGEFTPRQTMRGKFALYAYLHALERRATLRPDLTIALADDQLRLQPGATDPLDTLQLQRSPDLQSWSDTGPALAGEEAESGWTAPEPTTDDPAFYRLRRE